ncbi:hypothetical protein VaNZ11_006967 [Volvox africanus]|uniref:Sfi1 spindle body domain-containing protein n=1 Tax=Volvox africanus TaxID=51714 RepID=A0ABQ5S1V7_9CHLO|nr:hypothetical protein VaNZ11_006967 [Volvox africanus]
MKLHEEHEAERMDTLQKAQERLSLHELIRVGLGRQEDLRLLQNVAIQAACLPAASVAQLLREAALREEWRSGREAALLESLRSFGGLLGLGPGGGLSADDGRLLSEQMMALTEMLQQQQQRKRNQATASGLKQRAAGPSASLRTPAIPGRAPSTVLRPAGSASGASASGGVPLHPYLLRLGARSPRQHAPQPPSQQRQKLLTAMYPHGTQAPQLPRPSTTPAGLMRSATAGADVAVTSGFNGGSPDTLVQQHQRRRRQGSSAVPSSSISAAYVYGTTPAAGGSSAAMVGSQVKSRPRPGSAPDGLTGEAAQATRPNGLEASATASAAAVAAAAAAVNSTGVVIGGGPSGDMAQRSSGFRNLLRLQQLLLQGLREHAHDEGEGGALEALNCNVAQGQAFFAECLADALEAAGLPHDAVTLAAPGAVAVVRGQAVLSSATRRTPAVAWDKMLRLGQLGLTRSDVSRLNTIRRQQAARVIQRQVRKWLRRRWHQQRLAAARARADAMQRKLRDRAALVIQAWVRGHLARRLVAHLISEAAQEAAERRHVEAAREVAATRIQRGWRSHWRAVRYAAALAKSEELHRRQQQRRQQLLQHDDVVGAAKQDQGALAAARATEAGKEAGQWQGRERARTGETVTLSLERAVVVIQSHLRGWLVRRSSALWWARASHSLRERRAAVRAWRQHQRFMAISYGMQAQLLGALVREAQVAEALRADRRRQEVEMRTAFNDWLLQQQRVALSQPLPRGWVPHPHPNEPGRMCFLNTRTGELHALHPVLADLVRHAREQHSAALEALQQRFAGVPAYLAQLHEATAAQAAIALRAIAITYQSAAVLAPLPAGGAARAEASI